MAIGLGGAGVAVAASSLPSNPAKPPRPLVKSHGATIRAARGSYCWAQAGGGQAVCADYAGDPTTKRALPAGFHCRVRLDMGIPAMSLRLRLLKGAESRRAGHPVRVDQLGQFWSARLNRQIDAGSILLVFATYDRGDALFGVRLRPLASSC